MTIQTLFLYYLTLSTPFLLGFGPPRLTDRELAPTRRVTPAELRVIVEGQAPPEIAADALLVYDVDADRILYQRAMSESRPVASLTKLMTALLVWEEATLSDSVTILPEDLIGGATMGLRAGETLTVDELLWGLLVPSGNDAAMALARHVGGSVEAFVARMNERATELGLTASSFRNPHGLDAPEHLSSARDLLTLTQLNQAYPRFREMTATAVTTVAGYALESTNELLITYPGAVGVKTGTTDAAGQCLIAEIVRDGHPVLIEVLGSSDRYEDVRRLHAYYLSNYEWLSGDANRLAMLNRLRDDQGELWYLAAGGEGPNALVRRGEYPGLQAFRRIERPPAGPWAAGMTVGTLEWRLGDQLVGTQSLVLR